MKIRISTLAGETLALIDARTLLYVETLRGATLPIPPGGVVVIEAVSTAPAAVVKRANDRDGAGGLSMSELVTLHTAAEE